MKNTIIFLTLISFCSGCTGNYGYLADNAHKLQPATDSFFDNATPNELNNARYSIRKYLREQYPNIDDNFPSLEISSIKVKNYTYNRTDKLENELKIIFENVINDILPSSSSREVWKLHLEFETLKNNPSEYSAAKKTLIVATNIARASFCITTLFSVCSGTINEYIKITARIESAGINEEVSAIGAFYYYSVATQSSIDISSLELKALLAGIGGISTKIVELYIQSSNNTLVRDSQQKTLLTPQLGRYNSKIMEASQH